MKINRIILLAVVFCLIVAGSIFLITKLTSSSKTENAGQTVKEEVVSQPKQLTLAPTKSISVPQAHTASMNIPQSKSHTPFLVVLLAVLGVSQLGSIFLIMYLFKMRQYTPSGQISVVPEELLKSLSDQSGALGQNSQYIGEYIKRIMTDREKTDGDIVELQKSFAVFQDSLNKKDEEIDRLKKGYDTAVYERFLKKFIKFYVELKKEADAPENQENAVVLNDMLELFGDALIECNLQIKSPDVMASIEDYNHIISAKRKVLQTDNPELHEKIAQVLMPAFILGDEVLREANIVIYSYNKEREAT